MQLVKHAYVRVPNILLMDNAINVLQINMQNRWQIQRRVASVLALLLPWSGVLLTNYVDAKKQLTLSSWLIMLPLVRHVVQRSILTLLLLVRLNANAHQALYGLIILVVFVKTPMRFYWRNPLDALSVIRQPILQDLQRIERRVPAWALWNGIKMQTVADAWKKLRPFWQAMISIHASNAKIMRQTQPPQLWMEINAPVTLQISPGTILDCADAVISHPWSGLENLFINV